MKMKKFINNPENLTDELLDGLAAANRDIIHRGEENMIINNALGGRPCHHRHPGRLRP